MVATSGTQSGHHWYLAPSLIALFDEADDRDPSRDHSSDGSIGNAAHQSTQSDHNPAFDDGKWWVTAGDLDDDDDQPSPGVHLLRQHLVASKDPRVKYLIHEGTIWKAYPNRGLPAWTPQVYTGLNAHKHHLHVSVWNTAEARNDIGPWWPQEEFTVSQYEAIMQELREIKAGVLVSIDTANKALDRANSTYEKIVPTETVRADIRLTRDIAAKLGVSGAP